jgi:hypothetical protein
MGARKLVVLFFLARQLIDYRKKTCGNTYLPREEATAKRGHSDQDRAQAQLLSD